MPIHIPHGPGHWVLAIYERNGDVRFFDSLVNTMSSEIRKYVKSAVRDISNGSHTNPNVYEVHESELNRQIDAVNCGFHVLLNAESYLMNNGITFLNNFDIQIERRRILEILSGYLPGRNF